MTAGEVRQAAQNIPAAAGRSTLLHAYQVGFSTTLNHLMVIGAVVAFVGVVGGFVLVRQRDFVVPTVRSVAPGVPRAPIGAAAAGGA